MWTILEDSLILILSHRGPLTAINNLTVQRYGKTIYIWARRQNETRILYVPMVE